VRGGRGKGTAYQDVKKTPNRELPLATNNKKKEHFRCRKKTRASAQGRRGAGHKVGAGGGSKFLTCREN